MSPVLPARSMTEVREEIEESPYFGPIVIDGVETQREEPSAIQAEVFGARMDRLFDVVGPDPEGRWNGPGQLAAYIFGVTAAHASKWRRARRAVPAYAWIVLNSLAAVADVHGREGLLWALMDGETAPVDEHNRAGLRP